MIVLTLARFALPVLRIVAEALLDAAQGDA